MRLIYMNVCLLRAPESSTHHLKVSEQYHRAQDLCLNLNSSTLRTPRWSIGSTVFCFLIMCANLGQLARPVLAQACAY